MSSVRLESDLSSKTTSDLQEQYDRQLKLLKNRSFIDRLPDKGKKLQATVSEVSQELQRRNNKSQQSQTNSSADNLEWELILKKFSSMAIKNSCQGGVNSVAPSEKSGSASGVADNAVMNSVDNVCEILTSSSIKKVENLRQFEAPVFKPRVRVTVTRKTMIPRQEDVSEIKDKEVMPTSTSSKNTKVNWDESLVEKPFAHKPVQVLSLPESVVQSAKVYAQEKKTEAFKESKNKTYNKLVKEGKLWEAGLTSATRSRLLYDEEDDFEDEGDLDDLIEETEEDTEDSG